jgi:hypothetical protein
MEIRRSGSRPFETAPLDYFTGTVRIDPLFEAPDPARTRALPSSPVPAPHGIRIHSVRR